MWNSLLFGFLDIISRSIQKKPSKYDQVSLSEAFLRVARSMEPLWFQHPQHPIFPYKNKELHKKILGETLEHVMSMQSSLWKHFCISGGPPFKIWQVQPPLESPTAAAMRATQPLSEAQLSDSCQRGWIVTMEAELELHPIAGYCFKYIYMYIYIYMMYLQFACCLFRMMICDRGRLQPTEFTLPWKLFLLALPWNLYRRQEIREWGGWVGDKAQKSRDGIWIWRFENHSLYMSGTYIGS